MPEVLGEEERDGEAIRQFGRWRDRTKTTVLLGFAVVGVVLGAIAYYYVQEYQFEHNNSRALLTINVAGAAVPFLLLLVIGAFVARRVVLQRTPAKLVELAKAYEIPVERLTGIANMVGKL